MSEYQTTPNHVQAPKQLAENPQSEMATGGSSFAPPAFQLKAGNTQVIQRQDPTAEEDTNDYDALAKQLYDGIHYIWGTNEQAIYGALSSISGNAAALKELRRVYKANHDEDLIPALRGDTSGQVLATIAAYFAADSEALAILLFDGMDGATTDEDAVEGALRAVAGNRTAVAALKKAYYDRYGVDLRTDIQGDFSGGAEESMLALLGNEYESMESYRDITGRDELGPYEWLKDDRESQSGTWDTAMTNMTRDQVPDILQPFEQVRDYYVWIARKLDDMGHESRWVKGALVLVDELTDTYDEGAFTSGHWIVTPGKDVIPLLEDLNVGIVNYAITQFHRLMFGDLKDEPLKGTAAYEFDKQFVNHEQRNVAFDVYSKYAGTDAITAIDQMFNHTGFLGNALGAMTAVGMASEIPTHPGLIGADLTDAGTRYGEDARTHVPLYMLWPDQHRSEGDYPGIDSLMDQGEIDPWYNEQGNDPNDVYESYKRVNDKIMANEW